MEKSFEGITKKMFRGAYNLGDNEIVVIYEDTYDYNEFLSKSFEDTETVDNTEENRKAIEETFGVKFCWAKCYDGDGEETTIRGFFKDYDEFYEFLDCEYGYDVIDDGDE